MSNELMSEERIMAHLRHTFSYDNGNPSKMTVEATLRAIVKEIQEESAGRNRVPRAELEKALTEMRFGAVLTNDIGQDAFKISHEKGEESCTGCGRIQHVNRVKTEQRMENCARLLARILRP